MSTDLAEKAALYFASEAYGNVRTISFATFYDLHNNKQAYSFLLYRGEQAVPKLSDVLQQVSERRKRILDAEASLSGLSGDARTTAINALSELHQGMAQGSEFVTVVCGAHTGQAPVIMMIEGLPPYVVFWETVQKQLGERFAADELHFARHVYLGPFRLFLEFMAGERTILVEPHTGREIDEEAAAKEAADLLEKTIQEYRSDVAARERILGQKAVLKDKWAFIQKLPDGGPGDSE